MCQNAPCLAEVCDSELRFMGSGIATWAVAQLKRCDPHMGAKLLSHYMGMLWWPRGSVFDQMNAHLILPYGSEQDPRCPNRWRFQVQFDLTSQQFASLRFQLRVYLNSHLIQRQFGCDFNGILCNFKSRNFDAILK